MPPPPALESSALRSLFQELRARGMRLLRRDNLRRSLHRALPHAWRLLPVVPALVLLLQGTRALAHAGPYAPSWLGLLAFTLALPALYLARIALRAWRTPISPRAALALFDDAAGAEERLLAADDLLAQGPQTPFVAAALQDATPWLGRARLAEPVLPLPAARRTPLALGSAALTIALVLLALYVGGNPFGISTDGDLIAQPAGARSVRSASERDARSSARTPARTPTALPEGAPRVAEAPGSEGGGETPPPPQDLRPRAGLGGAGRSAEAASASGAGDARGRPSGEASAAQTPRTRRKPAQTRRAAKPLRESEDEEAPSPGEESGATSGRGASQGSDKNPVASDWRSRDQVTSEDDEEIEDDESVEDEEVDSEARGGVQPSLRDRKPAASRDLSVGFGNRPSPNANGRGGASQPKKSRGTASLVLGVPIPDRIKGRPNPGRTKVTQERVAPRAESAPAADAGARLPRSGPTGPLLQPALEPWLRALLRTYFTRLPTETTPPQETPDR